MSTSKLNYHCVASDFEGTRVHTFAMRVKDAIAISYVAARGRSDEEGAVQRILNGRRVDSIKEFVLEGNVFFNTFILNWTDEKTKPVLGDGNIQLIIKPEAAQILDGQHRMKGLELAMNEDDTIGEKYILVSLCISLTTPQAAKIFLNINTEQKPVPKSLIYDLFGEVVDDQEHAINRARDIARELNENVESPYYKYIKFPGSPRGSGLIDLSAVVSSLKESLKSDGIFKSIGLRDLESQQKVVINFLRAIELVYQKNDVWNSKNRNPFLKTYGFNGAMEYLTAALLEECAKRKSFKVETFSELLGLNNSSPLLHDDVKSLDGKTAKKRVIEYLKQFQSQQLRSSGEYEF